MSEKDRFRVGQPDSPAADACNAHGRLGLDRRC